MTSKGAFVVVGSGPGIGRNTADVFAERGFKHIFLLSRNASKLSEDASHITSKFSDAKVEIQQIDVSADEQSVRKALNQLDQKLEKAGVPLEAVLYNAARVAPSKVLEFEPKELAADLTISTVSLYITLQWAVPKLLETSKQGSYNPAFLTTSGGLYRQPEHFLFSLSAAKASQYNLMNSFHKKYEPQIHFASISVRGVVSDEAKVTTARAVAEQFYKLYEQKKGIEGEVSVELDDPDYDRQVAEHGKSLQAS